MALSTSQRSRQIIKNKVNDKVPEGRSPLDGGLIGIVHHGP
jgi:hypothetical protein